MGTAFILPSPGVQFSSPPLPAAISSLLSLLPSVRSSLTKKRPRKEEKKSYENIYRVRFFHLQLLAEAKCEGLGFALLGFVSPFVYP